MPNDLWNLEVHYVVGYVLWNKGAKTILFANAFLEPVGYVLQIYGVNTSYYRILLPG